MMEITEKAIKQHLSSNKKNPTESVVEEKQEKIEEVVENVIEDTLGIDEEVEDHPIWHWHACKIRRPLRAFWITDYLGEWPPPASTDHSGQASFTGTCCLFNCCQPKSGLEFYA